MTLLKLALSLSVAAALGAGATAAQAAVTVYGDASAFSAATTGDTAHNFQGIGEEDYYTTYPGGVTVGPATFNTPYKTPGNANTKGGLFVFGDEYRGNPRGTTAFLSGQGIGGSYAILDIALSAPTTAIAFDFGAYTTNGTTTDVFINGVKAATETYPGFQSTEFVGFTSSNPITSVEFRNASAPAVDMIDFTTGTAAAVPEPATWALLTLGLGLAGGALRLRRRGALAIA